MIASLKIQSLQLRKGVRDGEELVVGPGAEGLDAAAVLEGKGLECLGRGLAPPDRGLGAGGGGLGGRVLRI